MATLSQIRKPVQAEMDRFEDYFRSVMKSKVSLLDIIMRYIIKRKGKQMRPLFVFLTSRMFGEVGQSTFHAAALIELLHTSTLIHDDVVDDSYMRRGFFSVNALWKNKISVLAGDYLLSRGMLLAVENHEYELLRLVSEAVKEMSEGELLQIEKARRLDIDEQVYFEIIRKKTASLIAACTACGAQAANCSAQLVEQMKKFGMNVGIAFQIRDDIFDFQPDIKTGKPSGNDLKEKKLTLPLIYSLQSVNSMERKRLMRLIRRRNTDKEAIAEIVRLVHEHGGIDYAHKKMEEYRQEAIKILENLEESEARQALATLVDYSIKRKK